MKRLFLVFIFTISLLQGYSQKTLNEETGESFILNQPLDGSQSYKYTASEYIKMIEGNGTNFEYSPQPGQFFQAKIDPLLVFPPDEGIFGGPNPQDDGVVGTVPGGLSVSPSGAAVYSVPIDIPPGINGLIPRLAMVYNSQGGNGFMGMRWTIAGLSTITRTSTNYYHEEVIDGIDFDENDKLMLDGNRLIPINNGNEYRTEVETFSKIVPHNVNNGKPTWFEVYTKEGNIIEYGNTENSRIQAPGLNDVLTWHINKVIDRKGNYIEYVYVEETGMGRISQIKYAANGTDIPLYVVNFNYVTNRPDPVKYYLFGCLIQSNVLLQSIEVKYNSTVIKSYDLDYDLNGMYSHLENVTLWDEGKISKFNPTRFEWGEENTPFSFEQTNILGANDANIVTGDFNGDGKTDIVASFYSTSDAGIRENTTWSVFYATGTDGTTFSETDYGNLHSEFSYFMVLDINTDGLDDIVEIRQNEFHYRKSTGEDFTNLYTGLDVSNTEDHTEFAPVDINGNGINDLLLIRKSQLDERSSIYSIYVYEYDGSSFQHLVYDETTNYAGFNFLSSYNNLHVLPGDFDGDGKTDLLIETDLDSCSVYGFNKTDRVLEKIYDEGFNIPISQISNKSFTGDVNGDGITDLISVNTTTPTTSALIVRMFNGKNDWINQDFDIAFPENTYHYSFDSYYNYMVSDFNGDGKDDMMLGYAEYYVFSPHLNKEDSLIGTHWDVYYSNGTNVFREQYFQEGGMLFHPFLFDDRYSHCDFNGDGKNDNFVFDDNFTGVKRAVFFHKNEEKELIQKITNGLGNQVNIVYEPLTNNTIYTRDTVTMSKVKNIQPANYVVTSVLKDDGYGGEFSQTYSYEGAKMHLEGKGFLGFKKMTSFDPTTDIKNIATNSINGTYFYPFSLKQETYLGDELISETVNQQNTVVDFGNKRIFTYDPVSLNKTFSTGDQGSGYVKTVRIERNYSETDKYYGNISGYKIYVDEDELELSAPNSSYGFYTFADLVYNYDNLDDWLISRIQNETITKKYPDDNTTFQQTSTYSYYPQNDPQQQYPLLKTKMFIPNNTSDYQINTSFEYDNFGNITKKTIEAPNYNHQTVESRVTNYEYSEEYQHRFLTKSTKTLGNIAFIESAQYYPKTGLTKTTTDINGLTTQYFYDGFDRLNKTILPDGKQIENVMRWAFDYPENPQFGVFYTWSKVSGEKEVLSFNDNNGRGHLSIEYHFDGETKVYVNSDYYGSSQPAHGKLQEQSEPHFIGETALVTSYDYLPFGQVKTINRPTGEINYTYDGLTIITENLTTGQVVTKTTDPIGNILNSTDPGGTIYYKYNSTGKPFEVTNGEGFNQTTITMSYNTAGFQENLDDPDAGLTNYEYDPFGQLVSQTDNKGNNYLMKYDALGRITEKKLTNPEQITTYTYDGENGLGLPESVVGWNGISTSFTYDQYCRAIEKTETIEGLPFVAKYEYDVFGNLKKEIWPSDYALNYKYKNGYLCKVVESNTSKTLWQLNDMNARGQIKEYLLGNGLTTTKGYDNYGFPASIVTSNSVQNLSYVFDPPTGNLSWRKDLKDPATPNDDLLEYFGYDTDKFKARLTSWTVAGGQTTSMAYEDNGNINQKSDVGNPYIYNVVGSTGGPHAVSSIVQPTTGFLQSATPEEVEYNAFNKVSEITHSIAALKMYFTYGPDENRKKTALVATNNTDHETLIENKYFIGNNYEVETNAQGQERKLHYLYGGDGLFAIYVIENNAGTMYYIHKDFMGSYQAISSSNGNLIEKLSFDPWGRRRNPNDWTFTNVPTSFLFDRGYTGHEHLEKFNLINMNGRVYDPFVARFLSPDPFVQATDYTQSYNRYSYCLNNPLKYTDPSGYEPNPSDFAGNVWMTSYQHHIGPGSNNHWSDQFRSDYGNLMLMNTSTFNSIHGDGAWDMVNQALNDPNVRSLWQQGNLSLAQGMWVSVPNSNIVGSFDWDGVNSSQNQLPSYENILRFVKIENAQGGGGNSLYAIGMGLNAAGFFSSAGEYSNVINGSWRGVNGKWNSLEWGGNQWTGARANALSKAGYFKLASRGFFVVGTGISLYQGGQALLNGNYAGAAKSGLDIGMGAFATFGGPPGWIIGGGYFALDALGAFDRPMITTPYTPPMYAVPDNTYVAPRVIFPLR